VRNARVHEKIAKGQINLDYSIGVRHWTGQSKLQRVFEENGIFLRNFVVRNENDGQ